MRRSPGEHLPNNKNRSSKQNTWLTKHKSFYLSLSYEALKSMAHNGNAFAVKEMNRRDKIHEKNKIRHQRYLEKLEAKRSAKK